MILQPLIRLCTAILVAMTVASIAIAQTQINSERVVNELRTPHNSIEMLRNIKICLDNNSLIQAKVLTTDNLKRIFGAQRIVWDARNTANIVMIEAVDLARVVPDVHVGNIKMDGVGISIKKSINSNGKIKTELFLLFRNKAEALPYDTVMQVFNSSFTRTTPLPSPHRVLGNPVDANSNAEFTYTTETGAIKEIVILSFGANSTLSEATFIESEL